MKTTFHVDYVNAGNAGGHNCSTWASENQNAYEKASACQEGKIKKKGAGYLYRCHSRKAKVTYVPDQQHGQRVGQKQFGDKTSKYDMFFMADGTLHSYPCALPI
jgi:hypothetical protein